MAKHWKRCARRKLLRAAIKEADRPANVVPLWADPAMERARADFIEAGKAYCIAKCGGCDLTREPPA